MTKNECQEWVAFHAKLFPQVMDWFDDNADNREMILDAWAKALERTRLQDALKCTQKMVSGDVEHPNRFEIASLPAVVCRSCPRQPVPFSQLKGKSYNPTTGEVV